MLSRQRGFVCVLVLGEILNRPSRLQSFQLAKFTAFWGDPLLLEAPPNWPPFLISCSQSYNSILSSPYAIPHNTPKSKLIASGLLSLLLWNNYLSKILRCKWENASIREAAGKANCLICLCSSNLKQELNFWNHCLFPRRHIHQWGASNFNM